MTTTSTRLTAVRAEGTGPAPEAVAQLVAALRDGLAGRIPNLLMFFASSTYEPTDIVGPLADEFATSVVIGCSTAGEFTDHVSGDGGISAIALPDSVIVRSGAALAELHSDTTAGMLSAISSVERSLGKTLRSLDPANHVGFVLIDGMHGAEEAINDALGNAAPFLDIVGASAGDDLAFKETWVSVGHQVSFRGAALVVCETAVPFTVLKTCTLVPTGKTLRVTRADVADRTVHEFNDRPATEAYAEAVGRPVAELDSSVFMAHPLGVMVDGAPFVRSPQLVTSDGAIRFYCQIVEGMEVDVMQSGDIVADTSAAFTAAVDGLGGTVSGAVLFNCILRRLELDATGRTQDFVDVFTGVPVAGFHSYGESWLGHMNQTLTGVLFA